MCRSIRILLVLLVLFSQSLLVAREDSTLTSANLRALLQSKVGQMSNLGIGKFQTVWVGEEIPNDLFTETLANLATLSGRSLTRREGVAVIYFVGEDNLTRHLIKVGILRDLAIIDQQSFLTFSSLEHLFVVVQFPLMDQYGNYRLEVVAIQYLNRDTVRKINWELGIALMIQILPEASDLFTWLNDF